MGPYRYHTLERVELNEGSSLLIPATWTLRRASKEGWWYGDYERGTDLLLEIHFFNVETRGDSDVDHVPELVDIGVGAALNYFKTFGAAKEPIVEQTDRRAVVHSFIDEDDDGRPVRAFHWYACFEVDEGISLVHLNLGIPGDKVEEPECAELVQIFADQARRLSALGWDVIRTPVLTERRVGSIATVRIPESWECIEDDDGDWRCHDPEALPGKLIIGLTDYKADTGTSEEDLTNGMREIVIQLIDRITKSKRKPFVDFKPLDDGALLQTITDYADEKDDSDPPTRVITWYHVRVRRGTVINVNFSLFLPLAEVGTPYCVQLVEALTPAIEAAEIL